MSFGAKRGWRFNWVGVTCWWRVNDVTIDRWTGTKLRKQSDCRKTREKHDIVSVFLHQSTLKLNTFKTHLRSWIATFSTVKTLVSIPRFIGGAYKVGYGISFYNHISVEVELLQEINKNKTKLDLDAEEKQQSEFISLRLQQSLCAATTPRIHSLLRNCPITTCLEGVSEKEEGRREKDATTLEAGVKLTKTDWRRKARVSKRTE